MSGMCDGIKKTSVLRRKRIIKPLYVHMCAIIYFIFLLHFQKKYGENFNTCFGLIKVKLLNHIKP